MFRKFLTDQECARFGEDLRKEIAKRKLTKTAAAAALGVTRQSLYFHLQGEHQPRREVIARAVRLWQMPVYVKGQKFDEGAFGVEAKRTAPSVQLLLLPEAIDRLDTADLEVRLVKKEAASVRLEVLIKFAC